ncbi:MAG: hypothetical protein IKS31_01875 [Clostridia bacterium]|nr:hypothetical protein [Clostridia bacterium]
MNDERIVMDRMRYTKNTASARFAYLAILFNVLFFVSIYKTNDRNYYNILMGASIVFNLVFMLLTFLASEGVKNYKRGFSRLLIFLAILQIVRIFIFPVQMHSKLTEQPTIPAGTARAYNFTMSTESENRMTAKKHDIEVKQDKNDQTYKLTIDGEEKDVKLVLDNEDKRFHFGVGKETYEVSFENSLPVVTVSETAEGKTSAVADKDHRITLTVEGSSYALELQQSDKGKDKYVTVAKLGEIRILNMHFPMWIENTVMNDWQFIRCCFYLIASAFCLCRSAMINSRKSKQLEAHIANLEAQQA